MGWKVQRKRRKKGGKVAWYYEAIAEVDGTRYCHALGYLPGAPLPADVTKRLIVEGEGEEPTDPVWAEMTGLIPVPPLPTPSAAEPPQEPDDEGPTDYGSYTLRRFFLEVWWPIRSSEVAASTVENETKLWSVINDELGSYTLRDLDAVRWQRFLLGRETWGPTRKRLAQNAYRQCLKHAVDIGAVGSVHSFRPIKGASGRTRPVRTLTPDEIGRLLDACLDQTHRALYAVMGGCGLRPGEAVDLSWECWDFDSGILTVGAAGTKNRMARKAVPVAPWVLEEVRALWEEKGHPTDGFCFVHRRKKIDKPYAGFVATAKRAGLGHMSPGDMRHTFATTMGRQGVSRAAARRLMRHSSVSVILERAYEHLDAEDVVDVVHNLPVPKKAS